MLLLLLENFAQVLGHGVLAQRLALPHALAIIPDRLVLVVEVEAQHVFGFLRRLHRLGGHGRLAAEIVDELRDDQRVLELFAGVFLELLRDRHVFGALQHLRIHDVGDDRLVLPREIFVEQLDQLFPGT